MHDIFLLTFEVRILTKFNNYFTIVKHCRLKRKHSIHIYVGKNMLLEINYIV